MTTNPIDPDEMLHSRHFIWVYTVGKFMSHLYYTSHKWVKKHCFTSFPAC